MWCLYITVTSIGIPFLRFIEPLTFESLTFKSMQTSGNGHSVTLYDLLTEMKCTMISNFSTYLLVERMGLSTQTLWWYLLLPTSSSNSFASAALPPSNERPPSALAAVSKASWEKHQQIRCLATSLFRFFGLFAFQHFSVERCDNAKKMLIGNERRQCLSASIGQEQISSAKKTQEGNQSDHATQCPIIPRVKTTTVWAGTSSLVLHEALNTDS